MKKYLYCKKCKNYPNKIVEDGSDIVRREWDGESYQGYDREYGEGTNNDGYFCAECDTKLINK